MNKKLNLVKQFVGLGLLATLVILVVRWCQDDKPKERFQIDETPMRVEMIRNIAEIATISYQDEVVVDSLEFYQNRQEQIVGNIEKLIDIDDFKHGIRSSPIKRRLTLIVKGEIRFGFDLTNFQYNIQQTDSTISITFPNPKIVDIIVTPSSTEVFQENGKWKDYEINQLHNKARFKLIENAAELGLDEKAKENIRKILTNLVQTNRQMIVEFI